MVDPALAAGAPFDLLAEGSSVFELAACGTGLVLARDRDDTDAELVQILLDAQVAIAAIGGDRARWPSGAAGDPHQLVELLKVPDGSRVSALERLRRSPRRSSGPEMVKALQRAERVAELGVGRVDVTDIPTNRLQVLARTGLGSKATALGRLGEPKRTATLVAVVRHLEAAAVDDTLDLFSLLMGHPAAATGGDTLDRLDRGGPVRPVTTAGRHRHAHRRVSRHR